MPRAKQQTAREWLLENGYRETAEMIEDIIKEWKRFGKKTRRNWWDVLAGDREGNPRRIEGRVFPVYNGARKRQGLPPVSHAVDERKRALQEKELASWTVPTPASTQRNKQPDATKPLSNSFLDRLKSVLRLKL